MKTKQRSSSPCTGVHQLQAPIGKSPFSQAPWITYWVPHSIAWLYKFFPPASAVKSVESVLSVCVCVSVSALTAEPFDIQTRNLVEALTLIISRKSLKVKVIGQRSRSPCWKTWFLKFQMDELHWASLSWHLTSYDGTAWRHDLTVRRHVTSWYDIMTLRHDVLTSFDDFWARKLAKRARRGRACQRSGVFIVCSFIFSSFVIISMMDWECLYYIRHSLDQLVKYELRKNMSQLPLCCDNLSTQTGSSSC